MSTTPQMGLVLPVPSTSAPDWGGLLNTAFNLIDTHDHTAGHGIQVPSAGISINADLTFGGFNLTQARTLRLQQQAAAPALAADAGAIYATTAGDLWWNNGAGQHVQITSGAALSAASLGGISGLGGTSAGAAYSNATKTFTFTQAANQSALLDAGPLVIRDTAASAFGITLQSPVGIAGAYALTLPTALPAANALLSLGTSGVLSAFGTVSGVDLTLAGVLSWSAAVARGFLQTTASNSVVQVRGNRAATDTGADVELAGQVTRTAGLLVQIDNFATPKLNVDYQGLLQLASQAAPLQPSSLWTAITPAAGYAAFDGLAYWKDAAGTVHMKGRARSDGTGSATAFTLPVGFRPLVARSFLVDDTTGAGILKCVVNADGTVANKTGAVVTNGNSLIVDPISFLAEQ